MAITKVTSGLISADASSIDLNIDAGTLYLDVSENRVGIGTTSPDTLLNIASSSAPTLRIENTDSTLGLGQVIGAVEFYKTDTSGAGAGVAGGMQLLSTFSTGSKTSLVFSTSNADGNNVERLRIDESGNVGIGVTNPDSYDSRAERLVVGETGNAGITISGGASSDCRLVFAVTNQTDLSNGSITYDQSADSMAFETAGTERMRIDSSGNVLVGTTTFNNLSTESGILASNSVVMARGGLSDHQDACGVLQYSSDATWLRAYGDTAGSGYLIFRTGGGAGSSDTERMRIDSSGRLLVGIAGTSDSDFGLFNVAVAGASTGRFHIGYGSNGDNYYTVGSSGKHVFRQDTGERMRINSDGRVWIGSSNVTQLGSHLVVVDGSDVFGVYASTISAGVVCQTNKGGANGTDSTTAYLSLQRPDGTVRGTINATGTSGVVYNTTSDYRLKENVRPIQNGLERLNQLNPVKFDWKEDGTSSEGFIAHEVQEIFSDAVSGEKDGEKMQGVDYGRITPLLVKAIQEQQTIIDNLKTRIETLESA